MRPHGSSLLGRFIADLYTFLISFICFFIYCPLCEIPGELILLWQHPSYSHVQLNSHGYVEQSERQRRDGRRCGHGKMNEQHQEAVDGQSG